MGGVPSVILPDPVVYLGGSDVLGDMDFFRDGEITGCLSVCDTSVRLNVQRTLHGEGRPIEICHINLPDSLSSKLVPYFEEIVEFVFKVREKSFGDNSSGPESGEIIPGMSRRDNEKFVIEKSSPNRFVSTNTERSVGTASSTLGAVDENATNNIGAVTATVEEDEYVLDLKKPTSKYKLKEGIGGIPINIASAYPSGVYIHCQAGISRSTTSACAFLMTYLYPMTFREAIGHCHRCREAVCPNDSFREQLLAWEKDERRKILHEQMKERYPRQFEGPFMARDLEFMAKKLQDFEEKALELATTKWVYVSDGSAVPESLWSQITEDTNPNSPWREPSEGFKEVLRQAENAAEEESTFGKNAHSKEQTNPGNEKPERKIYRLKTRGQEYWVGVVPKDEWDRLESDKWERNPLTFGNSGGSGGSESPTANGGHSSLHLNLEPGMNDAISDGGSGRAKNWSLEDYDEQKRRLRERFQGLEAQAGGSIGLAWLLDKAG